MLRMNGYFAQAEEFLLNSLNCGYIKTSFLSRTSIPIPIE